MVGPFALSLSKGRPPPTFPRRRNLALSLPPTLSLSKPVLRAHEGGPPQPTFPLSPEPTRPRRLLAPMLPPEPLLPFPSSTLPPTSYLKLAQREHRAKGANHAHRPRSRHHPGRHHPHRRVLRPRLDVAQPPSVDAVLFLHGDTGHFYAGLYLELGQRMAEQGIAFLTGNRRGHDHVANGVRGGPLAGYAFESVDDARSDFAAWLELLRERGHRRIAIGGHSGGAVRAAYAQATERFDNVVAVMPVSPGEYNHEGVVALHGEDFAGPFRDSEQNVAEGRPNVLIRPGVPWGSTWSARAYVDCFNQDNRYSVTVPRRRTPAAPRSSSSAPKSAP